MAGYRLQCPLEGVWRLPDEPEHFVEFTVGMQPGIGCHLAAQERQLYSAVEIDP